MKKFKFSLFAVVAMALVFTTSCNNDNDDGPTLGTDFTMLRINEASGTEIAGTGGLEGSGRELHYYELINIGTETLSLAGVRITYNANAADGGVWPPNGNQGNTWIGGDRPQDPTTIGPGEIVLLRGPFLTGFSTSRMLQIQLLCPAGTVVDELNRAQDEGEYAIRDMSFSRIPDGTGPFFFTTNFTPGVSNGTVTTGLVALPQTPAPPAPPITLVIEDIEQDPATTSPDPGVDIVISAKVTDTENEIESVVIVWTLNGNAQTAIAMTAEGDIFTGTITGQAEESVVHWHIEAKSDGDQTVTSTTRVITWTAMVGTDDWHNLVLNEIGGEDNALFVEIWNSGATHVSLEGVVLDRNDGNTSWTGTADDIIPAGAYRIILFRNGRSDGNNSGADAPSVLQQLSTWVGWTVTGGLSDQQTLRIALIDPAGEVIDGFMRGEAPWGEGGQARPGRVATPQRLLDLAEFGDIRVDLRPSYSRMADGTWAWAITTPGITNGAATGEIVNSGYTILP
ncbi:MAG: lamin tail domain-containing protein [Bacteroidales bacterium]|nr:lamin tail domain-containing protein [Bacteroidales bacterium]